MYSRNYTQFGNSQAHIMCCSAAILSSSSPTRDFSITAEEVTKDSAGAMESLTPSTVTSKLSLQQPKIEINLFSPSDLNFGPFQQLETQLLDSMEISEQQSSRSHKPEVFGDECMEELGGNSEMLSPGDKNLACVDDMPPKRVKSHRVTNAPILRRSSTARNAPNALTQKLGLNKRLKHGDRLRKYIKENGKIPVIFRKKDGHPVGEYASMFTVEARSWAKTKSFYVHCRGSKSLSQYRYDADDGSGEKDGITTTSSNETDNSKKGAMTDNNNKQIGSDIQDGGNQSLGVDVAKRACDQIQGSRAGYVAGPRNGLRPAKSTSSDDTSLLVTNSELRKELQNTRIALQLTEDKIRMLEANQKRLEESVQANTQIMEANQRMMKQVFKRIASDITQSLTQLPSSAPPPPRL